MLRLFVPLVPKRRDPLGLEFTAFFGPLRLMADPVANPVPAFCGTSGGVGPLPSDPNAPTGLAASAVLGGIRVTWNFPSVNANALAYGKLYRGSSTTFSAAARIASVAGSSFFDRIDAGGVTRHYWLEIVSVNGTVLGPIGPATATTFPGGTIGQLIDYLSGQIDASMLAQSLRSPIEDIPSIKADVLAEAFNRTQEIANISLAISALGIDITAANATIVSQETTRLSDNEAFANQLNAVVATLDGNLAAVITESTARVTADDALASEITTLGVSVADNEAGIIQEATARADAIEAQATLIDAIEVNVGANTAAITQEASARATALSAQASLIDALEVNVDSNAAAIVNEATVRANEVEAVANQINTVAASSVQVFRQVSPPSTSAPENSIWFDTDDGNHLYQLVNGTWTSVRDGEIAGAFAAIQSEQTARTTADTALAQDVTNLESSLTAVEDGVPTAISAQIQDYNNTQVGFCVVNGSPNDNYTTKSACQGAGGTWLALGAIADAVKGVQINDGAGSARVEDKMSAYRDELGELNAQWTVQVETDTNGNRQVGGFGIFANGGTELIEAGFDVDRFWVGKSGLPTYPFIIEGNTVYMANAVIKDLSVDTLKLANGSVSKLFFATTSTSYHYFPAENGKPEGWKWETEDSSFRYPPTWYFTIPDPGEAGNLTLVFDLNMQRATRRNTTSGISSPYGVDFEYLYRDGNGNYHYDGFTSGVYSSSNDSSYPWKKTQVGYFRHDVGGMVVAGDTMHLQNSLSVTPGGSMRMRLARYGIGPWLPTVTIGPNNVGGNDQSAHFDWMYVGHLKFRAQILLR